MKKVVIFTTDNVVSSKRSPMISGAVPSLKGDDFLAMLPQREVTLAFEDFSSLPSSHITPTSALELAHRVESALLAPDVDGVVVAHGTDTLEESAFLLDLTIKDPKPVVFTGAMRSPTSLGFDGLVNLASAIRVAIAPEARDMGVLVVLNNQIHAASEVQMVYAQVLEAFQSLGSGPLGIVDGERVLLRHRPLRRQYIPCARLEEMVDIIRLSQGADDRLLRHSINDGVAGIVIETFGSGRVPPWWLPLIDEATQRRTAVVITSRCTAGSLGDEYGYVGAYHDLKRMNLLFAHQLNGLKARIKLMVALGAARNVSELRGWFREG